MCTLDRGLLAADARDRDNMLFDVWVNRLDVARLLDNSDIGDEAPKSLLNASVLDGAVAEIARLARDLAAKMLDRPYFIKPYRWAVTLANIRGIPYQLKVAAFNDFKGAMFVQNDDFARFAMPNGIDLAKTPDAKREDEFWVISGPDRIDKGHASYETMGEFTLGSAAFPVGFPARNLSRPLEHYRLRPMIYPKQEVIDYADVAWPEPIAEGLGDDAGVYRFTSVDGGMFNVDPVSLVHRELAGLLGRNPRDPREATRGLFMIDPLASLPKMLPATGNALPDVLGALIGSAIGGGAI